MADWHGWYYKMTGEVNNPKLKEMMQGEFSLDGLPEELNLSEAQLQDVSMAELQKHTSREDCWLAIDGVVYDITPWLQRHPGGAKMLLEKAGSDASKMFHLLQHSDAARAAAKRLVVGRLAV